MAKYFDEEWPKEEEILRIGLEQSRRNKADRFPTADERWPRAGKIMKRRAFIIGNGESRKNFDLTTLKKYGKIYACNACLLYTSPSPRDVEESRMPSSA